ncbi:MAG: GGDEF domain-containing protein [Eubacteriales bacterium]|nr:GGDEF domain-containing protein [Eubacteriales bacterium]
MERYMEKKLETRSLWEKIFAGIMITAVLCMAGILAVCVLKGGAYRITYLDGNVVSLQDGWSLVTKEGSEDFSFPNDYACDYGQDIILEKNLESMKDVGNILKLQFLHLKVKVYADEDLIYTFGEGDLPFSGTPARTVHFVKLPQNYDGMRLRLVLTPSLKGREIYRMSTPVLGNTFSLLGEMLHNEAFALGGAVVLIFLGFCIIFFSFFVHRLKFAGQILYLGTFALLAGVFSFCETELALLLVRNSYLVHTGDAVALQLICLPFFGLLSINCPSYWPKAVKLGAILMAGNFAVQNVLNFIGKDYRYYVLGSHLLIVYCVLLIAAILILAVKRKDKQVVYYILTFVPIALCAVPELINFYWLGFPLQGFFFEIGIFLFVLLQIGGISIQIVGNYQQATRSQMFQEMAFTDYMTKLRNRTAYQQRLDSLSAVRSSRKICCAMADVNHLKQVNDTLGHEKGDALILETAQALEKVFGSIGEVYRIGGDEFAVILENVTLAEMERLEQEFKAEVRRRNELCSFPVEAAFGYAIAEPEHENLEHTFVRADNAMYEDKKKYYNSRGRQR